MHPSDEKAVFLFDAKNTSPFCRASLEEADRESLFLGKQETCLRPCIIMVHINNSNIMPLTAEDKVWDWRKKG